MKKPRKPSQELAQAQVQRQDLRLFAVLASSEEDFLRQSAELEADPLFARLCAPGPDGSAPVLRRRLPGASYAFSLACGDDALAAAAGPGGTAGEWLAARPEMLALARRVGLENFEKFFLSDSAFSPAAAARACGCTPAEAAALKTFAAAFLLAHEHIAPAALPRLYLRCAASVGAEGGKLSIAYTHPSYLRGACTVDHRALASLVKSGGLTPADAARAAGLAARAQRLAWRRAGFHRVILALVEAQSGFLLRRSGLAPLTQRELAARSGLDPATVSRLIASRTLLAPWGDEIKLKDLFLAKNAFIIDKIKAILGAADQRLTDTELTAVLRTKHGIRVSRRSVNLYRSKL
ncbi:MAG: hypothetical protein A2X32_02985 [Elusimicrobia bacterium GWC2_64_44]|nr:MAG: hypothetical protein A2X32_02985 [Elusimicrobia bacterium GWC2_64_44]